MTLALAIVCVLAYLIVGYVCWRGDRRMRATRTVPMSGEVLAQHIRDTLHAELAAAGLETPQHADGLEELWEASP